MQQHTMEYEYLSLISNFPSLLERNILQPDYFIGADKVMFSIMIDEYKKHKEFIPELLTAHKNFDVVYYYELLTNNLWFSSKEIKFEELQKGIIEKYKNRKYKEIINSYDGNNYQENLKQLECLNDINYQENSYITAEDVILTLKDKKQQVLLGYPRLDSNLNLSQNDLLILAGGTGGGKTAFALNLLYNLSRDYQCIYFNMEMSKNILYKRLIALSTNTTMMELNDVNGLDNPSKELIVQLSKEIEQRKIILVNNSVNVADIKKNILNIKTNRHIIVFLDHIGLIKSSGNSLYEKMTNVAKALRGICLDCNCTVIGLSQLSRMSQVNNDEPKLQDLRDSGEVEQSARKVLMLHDKNKGEKTRKHDVNVIIAKNDDGNTTTQEFTFDRHIQKFKEK